MRSAEISENQWVSFFDEFSQEHAGWPATIEVLSPETGPQRLAADLPLLGISFDPEGSRPCTIQIGAGDEPSASILHTIDMPLHIRVADDERHGEVTLQIEPARGPSTLVHLHRPFH